MAQPETLRRICPYLGVTNDPASHYREPDAGHYCYSPKQPGVVELEHQKQVCFSTTYGGCARYTAFAGAPTPVAFPTAQRNRSRWFILGLVLLIPLFILVGALVVLVPRSGFSQFAQASLTPVQISTPRFTETSQPTATPSATPIIIPTLVPLIIPTPPANGTLLTLAADPNRTGWIATNETAPRWGDRTLLAGSAQNQNYVSIVQFDMSALPLGSRVSFGVLELTGRDSARLGSTGDWQIELVDSALAENWQQANFNQIMTAPALTQVGTTLTARQLDAGQPNRIEFNAAQRQLVEKQIDRGTLTFRVRGPANTDNLFTWAAGSGSPALYLVVVPGAFTIVTTTPTPENVLTAAAMSARATDSAVRFGTPTRARGVLTATPELPSAFVTALPTPANSATAQSLSQYATAVALTTGTFTPTPSNVRVVTMTPTPLFLPAARLTLVPTATPTALPVNYSAVVMPDILRGKIIALSNRFPVTPVSQITPTPDTNALGPAMDRSNFNANVPIVIDPLTGKVLGILTNEEFYQAAVWRDAYSPDGRMMAYTTGNDVPQIYIYNFQYDQKTRISDAKRTTLNRTIEKVAAHSPAWSPDGNFIVYVANTYGNDELYRYDIENKITTRLTISDWWWYKHPSWSPDGKKIVYWSNQTGIPQIWLMDSDGQNQVNLSNSPYNEINPVWVK